MNNTTSEAAWVLPEYIAWTSLVLCSVVLAVGVLGEMIYKAIYSHSYF